MNGQRPSVPPGRQWLLIGFVLLLCAAGAVVGVLFAAAHPAESSQPHHHHGVLFAAVFAVVMGVAIAVALMFLIRRRFRQPELQQLFSWSFGQRRATARAIQKGQPLSAEQRSIAEAQLEQLGSASRRMTWLAPLGLIALVMAAVAGPGALRLFWIVLVVLETVCFGSLISLQRVQTRRYRRALALTSNDE